MVGRHYPGKAGAAKDVRTIIKLEPDELPWPIWFSFIRAVEDDGKERWICTGFEVGGPIVASGVDTDEYELTRERRELVGQNFDRLRQIAEMLISGPLIREVDPVRVDRAERIRRSGRPGDRLTPDRQAVFADNYRRVGGPEGKPGWAEALADEWNVTRFTVYKRLDKMLESKALSPAEYPPEGNKRRNTE